MLFQKKGISELVSELTDLLNKHNLTEIEYEKNGTRIKVSNGKGAASHAIINASGIPSNSLTAAEATANSAPLLKDMENALKSPMVGVIYLKPEPTAKSFVAEGQGVKEGDVLCLIEAMKTFNQIKAEKSGTVKKILVQESETVEYGQPLFVIE